MGGGSCPEEPGGQGWLVCAAACSGAAQRRGVFAGILLHVRGCASNSLPCNRALLGLAAVPSQGRAVRAKKKLMLLQRFSERDICNVAAEGL